MPKTVKKKARKKASAEEQVDDLPEVVDEPIELGPVSRNGIRLKWDLTQISELLLRGQKFIIFSLKEYHSIFRVMDRRAKSSDMADTHMLKRKAIGEDKYAVAWLPSEEELDDIERDPDFNPKYGRWREAAEVIANGGQLWFPSAKDCRSVSYSWRINYSQAERKGWYAKTHKLEEGDYQAAIDAGLAEDIDLSKAEGYGYLIFLAPKS